MSVRARGLGEMALPWGYGMAPGPHMGRAGLRMRWWDIATALIIAAVVILHRVVRRKLRQRRDGTSEHR